MLNCDLLSYLVSRVRHKAVTEKIRNA